VPRRSYTPTTYMLLILMFLLMPTWCRPQNANSAVDPVSVAVTQILKQQQTAWNQGDIPSFMQGYWKSPELSFSGSGGVSRGWLAVLARYQRNYPDKSAMGHLEFSELEVHLLGDAAALVLGKWHLKRESGDIGGVFTLVFQRFPDGWKIIHDHTSQVQPGKP
jgi:ketosteroid isomerase-like protein